MPIVVPALQGLLQTKIDSELQGVQGISPLGQQNPAYFIAMCNAIGTGIAAQATINFTTVDEGSMGAPPVPGVGAGVGIFIDAEFFEEKIYTKMRDHVLADYGATVNEPYPPGPTNLGQFPKALCKGIATAIKEHFETCWVLASAHPIIYEGEGQINPGAFGPINESSIISAMIAAAPNLQGPFWPKQCDAIAKAYKETIEQTAFSMVTISGTCVASPSQVCGIGPSPGVGTGAAA